MCAGRTSYDRARARRRARIQAARRRRGGAALTAAALPGDCTRAAPLQCVHAQKARLFTTLAVLGRETTWLLKSLQRHGNALLTWLSVA